MSWLRSALRRLIDRRPDVIDDDIDTHLALETEDNVARGMSPTAAHDAARRAFGNTTLVRERVYEMRRVGWIDRCGRTWRTRHAPCGSRRRSRLPPW